MAWRRIRQGAGAESECFRRDAENGGRVARATQLDRITQPCEGASAIGVYGGISANQKQARYPAEGQEGRPKTSRSPVFSLQALSKRCDKSSLHRDCQLLASRAASAGNAPGNYTGMEG